MPIDTITGLVDDIGVVDWNNLAAVTATSDNSSTPWTPTALRCAS